MDFEQTRRFFEKARERFGEDVSLSDRPAGEGSIVVAPSRIRDFTRWVRDDEQCRFDFFGEVCATDFLGRSPRFDLTYTVYSTTANRHLHYKTGADEPEAEVDSVADIYPGAAWHEREIFDMFGVSFRGHPDLRRILMPDHWRGHPLRKDYPLGGEEVQFSSNFADITPQTLPPAPGEDIFLGWDVLETRPGSYTRLLESGAELQQDGEGRMVINMGPQHPSTHGVLRLLLELDGENVVKAVPDIGFLHTGIEKTGESLNYQQALTLTDRMDYLSPMGNNLAFSLSVEKLVGLEPPERATVLRVIFAELTRIQSHLVWLGTHALDLGAMSAFFYCFRERDQILDMFEMVSGVRMMTSYICPGGLREDVTDDFVPALERFLKVFPERLGEYETLLTRNPIWLERTQGVGRISAEDAVAYGVSGASLRGSGVRWDVRKAEPYCGYETYDFEVPVGTNGDVYDRYLCRIEEMRQSHRIIRQALSRLRPGPVQAEERKVVPPPKSEIGQSMESLIHHFLITTIGFIAPPGEGHVPTETGRGLLSFYIVGDGSPKPYRMRARTPSFANLQALPRMLEGCLVADAVATIGSIDIVLGEIDR